MITKHMPSKTELIDQTVQAFANKYPDKSFYTRRIRMFIDYTAKTLLNSTNSSEVATNTASKESDEAELQRFLKERFNFE